MPRPKITIEERVGKVYKITSPSGKIYIGSTYQWINARWGKYLNKTCPEQPKLLRSLNKYGPEAHTFEIIWEGDWREMYKMERLCGEQFDVLGPKGLNCQLPGYNDVPAIRSDETKEKLSQAGTGRFIPAKTEEQRKRMSEGQKNRKPFTRDYSKTTTKTIPTLVYDKDGNFLKEFSSAKEASEFTGCSRAVVSECCRNPNVIRKGFIFKFKQNYSADGSIKQIDPHTGKVIKVWDSVKSVVKELKFPVRNLNACANGKALTCMGFKWEFVDSNFCSYKTGNYKHTKPRNKG